MTDSRIKILISFLLITAITVMKHWYLPISISLLCIVLAAKLKVIRDYGKKLRFPLVLALFIFVTQGFTYGVNAVNLGIVSVYSEGIEYGFLIFSRVFASASILLLLVITTSENELLESMRYFGVPKTMLEISSFMARYIKTFSSEGKKLKLAQKSRCGFPKNAGFKKKMHSLASISGALITRAFARSEEVYRAMLSRGWKQDLRYSIDCHPLNKRDLILGIILSSGIFVLLGLDRLVW
ncbi:MAG: cobalt ECF transporter T component CbiQ [Candidatus Methanoperedens sp.]|nr:cobalt ECF transporter T component CbiQ [Candidatus Methanoperedens sp.]